MRDEIRAAYNAAFDKASGETDTWRCPECKHEVQFSGAVHIEWGTPECHHCNKERGERIALELCKIEPVN